MTSYEIKSGRTLNLVIEHVVQCTKIQPTIVGPPPDKQQAVHLKSDSFRALLYNPLYSLLKEEERHPRICYICRRS